MRVVRILKEWEIKGPTQETLASPQNPEERTQLKPSGLSNLSKRGSGRGNSICQSLEENEAGEKLDTGDGDRKEAHLHIFLIEDSSRRLLLQGPAPQLYREGRAGLGLREEGLRPGLLGEREEGLGLRDPHSLSVSQVASHVGPALRGE